MKLIKSGRVILETREQIKTCYSSRNHFFNILCEALGFSAQYQVGRSVVDKRPSRVFNAPVNSETSIVSRQFA